LATRKKTTSRRTTIEQRVAEYIDSPQVTHRIKQGKQLTARILGNYGVYWTSVSATKKTTGSCSCPSDLQPCKHIYALRETWRVNPGSFFGLDQWLAELFDHSKATLIEAIAVLVMRSPESLGVLGIPGFEDKEGEQEDEDQDWYD